MYGTKIRCDVSSVAVEHTIIRTQSVDTIYYSKSNNSYMFRLL